MCQSCFSPLISDDFRTTLIALFGLQIMCFLAVGILTVVVAALSCRAVCSCSCCRRKEKEAGGIVAYNATSADANEVVQEMSNAVTIPVAGKIKVTWT